MRVVEIFHSRQGEGLWTGMPSFFVRTGGCNLGCRFCDTRYAAEDCEESEDLTPEQIMTRIQAIDTGCAKTAPAHVVLTGGEPMRWRELVPLTELLRASDMTITIETAGTIDLPVVCDLISISPKLSNADPPTDTGRHRRQRHHPEIVRSLIERYDYQLKFVVDRPEDVDEVESYLLLLPNVRRERVLLMPQGTDPDTLRSQEDWLHGCCDRTGFVFSPRMHVFWYGNQRGK